MARLIALAVVLAGVLAFGFAPDEETSPPPAVEQTAPCTAPC